MSIFSKTKRELILVFNPDYAYTRAIKDNHFKVDLMSRMDAEVYAEEISGKTQYSRNLSTDVRALYNEFHTRVLGVYAKDWDTLLEQGIKPPEKAIVLNPWIGTDQFPEWVDKKIQFEIYLDVLKNYEETFQAADGGETEFDAYEAAVELK